MACTGVPSGKEGYVMFGASEIAHVRNIRSTMTANVQTFADSSTDGHECTVKGQFGGTLSFDTTYNPNEPIHSRLKPGDQITLSQFYRAGHSYQYPCRINELGSDINVATGAAPTIAVAAILHGAWTYPDGTTSAG